MKKIILSILATLTIVAPQAQAQINLMDDGLPERLFVFGVRAAINTSNLSDNLSSAQQGMKWTNNQWKAGFSMGVVCDINVRNFLTLQPGLFLQRRNHDYTHMISSAQDGSFTCNDGNRSSYYFQIPILASWRVDFTDDFQWQLDFGPYFLYGIDGDDKYTSFSIIPGLVTENVTRKKDYFGSDGMVKGYDWGFKMGTGLVVLKKYYVGIHYEAGCRNVLKPVEGSPQKYSAHNKAWQFSIGYNF